MEAVTSAAPAATYDEEEIVEAFSNTVDVIVTSILANRALNLLAPVENFIATFKTTLTLTDCDTRTQKIYCSIVAAVKEHLRKTPMLESSADLQDSAPLFLVFGLPPTKDFIAMLDKEQPGAIDDLVRRAEERA